MYTNAFGRNIFADMLDIFVDLVHMIFRTKVSGYTNRYGENVMADIQDMGTTSVHLFVHNIALFLAVAVIGFAWQPLIVPAAQNLGNLLNPAPQVVINPPAVIVVPSQTQTLTATPSLTETMILTVTSTSTPTLTATPIPTLTPTSTSTPTVSTAECKVLERPLAWNAEEKYRAIDEFFETYPYLGGAEDSPSFVWTTYPPVVGGVWMVIEVNKFQPGEVVPQDGDAIRAGATKYCVREGGGFILLPP